MTELIVRKHVDRLIEPASTTASKHLPRWLSIFYCSINFLKLNVVEPKMTRLCDSITKHIEIIFEMQKTLQFVRILKIYKNKQFMVYRFSSFKK